MRTAQDDEILRPVPHGAHVANDDAIEVEHHEALADQLRSGEQLITFVVRLDD